MTRPGAATVGAVVLMAALLAPIFTTPSAYAQPQPAKPRSSPTWFSRGTDMKPRIQWNANDGYCGETSFISAGMKFGQYTSQWTARSIASPGVPQHKARAQLLLGVNDLKAAKGMRLAAKAFDSKHQASVPQYLAWIKGRFLAGNAVIMGVLNNTFILNESGPGQSSYDHIVPVFGIGSAHRLGGDNAKRYFGSDTITISDNGLHNIGPNYPFLYTYRNSDFPLTRAQANRPGGPVYSLRDRPKNYATAVTGVLDPTRVTVPVRLTSNANGEGLQNEPILKRYPTPTPITLTAHVSLPNASVAYRVYLYSSFSDVPTRDFNAHADRAMQSWTIPAGTGPHWRVTINAMSDQTRVFRAVPVSAP